MEKNKRRCDTRCQAHKFAITNPDFAKLDADTTFCPKYHRQPREPQNTFPMFNHDRKYFTCAFTLGVDRVALERNEKQQLMDHNRQVREALDKTGKIVFPRPHKKHTHCAVCKQRYKNYYAHIMSQQHKAKINVNQFNHYILELAEMYKEQHQEIAPFPINIVDIGQQTRTKEKNQEGKKERNRMIEIAKETRTIPKEIVEYIISSDSQDESSSQSDKKSSQTESSGQSSGSSSSQEELPKRVDQINLDSDEDNSVQIISVRTVKKPKKSKKISKEKKSNKKSQKSNQKTQQKPPSKVEKKKEKKRERSSSSEKKKVNKNKVIEPIKKKGKLGKQALPASQKPTQTLIIKQQVNDPMREKTTLAILGTLVESVNAPKPGKQSQVAKKLQQRQASINSPFMPPNLKRNFQEKMIAAVNNALKSGVSVQKQGEVSEQKKNATVNSGKEENKRIIAHVASMKQGYKTVLPETVKAKLLQQKPQEPNKPANNYQFPTKAHPRLPTQKLQIPKPSTSKRMLNNDFKSFNPSKSVPLDPQIQQIGKNKKKKLAELQLIKQYQQKKVIQSIEPQQSHAISHKNNNNFLTATDKVDSSSEQESNSHDFFSTFINTCLNKPQSPLLPKLSSVLSTDDKEQEMPDLALALNNDGIF